MLNLSRLFFFLVSLGIFVPLFAQEKNLSMKGTDLNLENNDDYSTFAPLDSAAKKYKVFFNGEDHTYIRSNTKLELKTLKYLYKFGVRVHLIEFGQSVGWLADQYIQTGDTTFLNALKDQSYRNYSELFKGLREFNKTLDSNQRIHVVGLDLEWSPSTACKALSYMIPKNVKVHDSIALSIESILGLSKYAGKDYRGNYVSSFNYYSGNFSIKNSVEGILKVYTRHKEKFRETFGKDSILMRNILQGLEQWLVWDKYQMMQMMQGTYFREQFMYNRFMETLKQYPDAKFFGQFGRCHVANQKQDEWCNGYDFSSVASRINASPDTLIHDKVCSIAIYYPNGRFNSVLTFDERKLKDLFASEKKEGFTLYRLGADTSITKVMTHRFQFLIVNHFPQEKDEFLDGDSEPEEDSYYNSWDDIHYHFEAFAGLQLMELNKLNDFYKAVGFDGLSEQLEIVGGAFTVCENEYTYANLSYSHIMPQEKKNDTLRITFGGNYTTVRAGSDLVPKNWLMLAPYIGFGAGKLNMDMHTPGTQSGLFGEQSGRHYENPVFTVDLGVDFRMNLGFIGIGMRGGYVQDLSRKDWKTNGQFVDNSPRTGLSGFYAQAVVSLFLKGE